MGTCCCPNSCHYCSEGAAKQQKSGGKQCWRQLLAGSRTVFSTSCSILSLLHAKTKTSLKIQMKPACLPRPETPAWHFFKRSHPGKFRCPGLVGVRPLSAQEIIRPHDFWISNGDVHKPKSGSVLGGNPYPKRALPPQGGALRTMSAH